MASYFQLSPDMAARFRDAYNETNDDMSSRFSDNQPRASKHFHQNPNRRKGNNRKRGFHDEEDDESRQEEEFVEKREANNKFYETMCFKPVASPEVDFLTCQNMQKSEEEIREKKQKLIDTVEECRRNKTNPNFLEYAEQAGSSKCILCEIRLAEIEAKGVQDPVHPLTNAYSKLVLYDLENCGRQTESEIMNHCCNIFNQLSAEYALQSDTRPLMLTESEVLTHLYQHDMTNPKRWIVINNARVSHLLQNCFNATIGLNAEGKTVFQHTNISHLGSLIRMQGDLSSKYMEACMVVSNTLSGSKNKSKRETQKKGSGLSGNKKPAVLK